MEDSRQDLRTEDEKRSEDGGMRMEESGKRVEDGRWRMEDGGMKMEDGGRPMEGGGWRKPRSGCGSVHRPDSFSKALPLSVRT